MTLPVLIVTGFLGAGKTTIINRMLQGASGRRIAAVVNDFGAINIDAALIAQQTDTVIGLQNGCICCSLQGDLMRTLKQLVERPQPFDHVVIEASGVADPQGIIDALNDPELWAHARLNAVLTVLDAEELADNAARFSDPLWQAQLAQADFVVLNKTKGTGTGPLRAKLAAMGRGTLFEADVEALPLAILLDAAEASRTALPRVKQNASDRFVTLEWQSAAPGRFDLFQQAIDTLSPTLVRAKGLLSFRERPGRPLLFQLVGARATLVPYAGAVETSQLVLIGERGTFEEAKAKALIDAVFAGDTAAMER
jgi:G3E family GTPase